MAEVHQRPPRGKGTDPPTPREALDISDREAARAWLADLRAQVEDLGAAAEDATRSPGRRELGRRAARRTILGARKSTLTLLDAAERGTPG